MEKEGKREQWATLLTPVALILGLVVLLSLEVGNNPPETGLASPLESWLKWLVGYVAAGTELAAAFVIGIAILQGFVSYLRQLVAPSDPYLGSGEAIRLRLGRVL